MVIFSLSSDRKYHLPNTHSPNMDSPTADLHVVLVMQAGIIPMTHPDISDQTTCANTCALVSFIVMFLFFFWWRKAKLHCFTIMMFFTVNVVYYYFYWSDTFRKECLCKNSKNVRLKLNILNVYFIFLQSLSHGESSSYLELMRITYKPWP